MPTLLHTFDTATSVLSWHAINDGVMGGVSVSQLRFVQAGYAAFEGVVSLQNNGGFASVRTTSLALGSAATTAYGVTAWGDGRTYKLNLRTDAGFDGLNFQASFTPPAGQWNQLTLPVSAFLPNFRGRVVQGGAPLRPECAMQVGLMIADKQVGPFCLMVKSIEAIEFGNLAAPQFRGGSP